MPITLEDIYRAHREWLELKSTDVIDLKLAMEIARQIHVEEGGKPLWLNLVAPSGSAKGEFLDTFLAGMPLTTYDLPTITVRTLVTGLQGGKDHVKDMDKKLVLVGDASRITSVGQDTKHEIFGQLRDLYDGKAGRLTGGTKSEARYNGLSVTMLWAATPAIEKEIILSGDLGTRFLMYYYDPPESKKAMDMMLKRMSRKKIDVFKKETGELEASLCRAVEKEKTWEKIQVIQGTDVASELEEVAEELSVMRATADIYWATGATTSEPSKEEPTRIFGQFVLLYRALMSLPEYDHGKAMRIIRHVAYSSGSRRRKQIYEFIKQENAPSTNQIAENLRLSIQKVRSECYILWGLHFIDKEVLGETDAANRLVEVEHWHHPDKTFQTELPEKIKEKFDYSKVVVNKQ
jgi:hypothetical protein